METENKPKEGQQAPAEGQPKVEDKHETIKDLSVAQLQDLYKRTPQIFKDAGILPKEEKPKEEAPKKDPPASAAPKYGDYEVQIPKEVPLPREAVDRYLAHAKEIGLAPEQVQKQIDWQVATYREQVKMNDPAQLDAKNVATLKADPEFGKNFDENMEVARQAAAKHASPEMLRYLKASDPVIVKHFYELGKLNREDSTKGSGNRTGNEDPKKSEKDQLKGRYNNTPQMFNE